MTAEKDLAENRSGDEAGAFHGGAKSFLIRRRVKPRADVNGDEELMILIVRCASHSEITRYVLRFIKPFDRLPEQLELLSVVLPFYF